VDAYEFEQDGRFNFNVEIALPIVGFVIRYEGCLTPPAGT